MKKLILSLVVGLVGFSSCTKEQPNNMPTPEALKYSTEESSLIDDFDIIQNVGEFWYDSIVFNGDTLFCDGVVDAEYDVNTLKYSFSNKQNFYSTKLKVVFDVDHRGWGTVSFIYDNGTTKTTDLFKVEYNSHSRYILMGWPNQAPFTRDLIAIEDGEISTSWLNFPSTNFTTLSNGNLKYTFNNHMVPLDLTKSYLPNSNIVSKDVTTK